MSKPTVWGHTCSALRAISYLSIELDHCPECNMPKKLRARKGSSSVIDPPSGSGEAESRKRRPRGKELFPRSEAHRKAVREGGADLYRRRRIAAALPEIRSVCWSPSEGDGELCDLCGATVPDGADQAAKDAAHLPDCVAVGGVYGVLEGL
jgi:hypothetical protein